MRSPSRSGPAPDDSRRVRHEEVAAQLAELMQTHGVPGAGFAVVENCRVSATFGLGTRRAGTAEQVDGETVFRCGSISKVVAALTALALVDAGQLGLDEDVNRRLVSWKVPESPLLAGRPVTLRRLLSHRGGFLLHSAGSYPLDGPIPTLTQLLNGAEPARNGPVRVGYPPGDGFKYSGAGYMVVEQLIADVTGREFSAVAAECVLHKFGMNDSAFALRAPAEWHSRTAYGHTGGKALPEFAHAVPAQAAGGLWTTANDLGRLIVRLQELARGDRSDLLRPQSVHALFSPPDVPRHGLGVMLVEAPPRVAAFMHNGAVPGFEAHLVGGIQSGFGVAVLANSFVQAKFATAAANLIARAYLPHQPGGE